jgi:hypothetical protein
LTEETVKYDSCVSFPKFCEKMTNCLLLVTSLFEMLLRSEGKEAPVQLTPSSRVRWLLLIGWLAGHLVPAPGALQGLELLDHTVCQKTTVFTTKRLYYFTVIL